jgi:transcriptional regulator with XRE-family HTH domain
MDKKEFGGIVRKMRKELRLTQKELAKRAYICKSHLGNIENGRRGTTEASKKSLLIALKLIGG